MNGTPQIHSPNIDTDDFVAIGITPNDPAIPPSSEVVRYDQFVRWLFKPGTEQVMALHIAIGVSGEVAELLEAIRCGGMEDRQEELGDVEFYFQALRNHYGVSLSSLLDMDAGETYLKLSLEDSFVICSGKILDCIKREYIYNKPRDTETLFYQMSVFAQLLKVYYDIYGFSRAGILQANADKLAKRYVSLRYSDAAAIARADKNFPDAEERN